MLTSPPIVLPEIDFEKLVLSFSLGGFLAKSNPDLLKVSLGIDCLRVLNPYLQNLIIGKDNSIVEQFFEPVY